MSTTHRPPPPAGGGPGWGDRDARRRLRRRSIPLLLLLFTVAAPTPEAAAGAVRAESVVIVGRAADGAPWRSGPTQARKGDDPQLAVVVVAREGRRRVYVADEAIDPLIVDGRRVRARQRRGWDALGDDVAVRWSMVEPHAWREDGARAPNGATARFHTNVSMEPSTFGRWLGYDEITYFETVVDGWSRRAAARRRPASARPPRREDDVWGGFGTMRYKVEVRLGGEDGEVLATAGAEATDRAGISPRVHRVSIRRDDSFIGWVTAYFMVPEVFGSAGAGRNHQTERFTGADCADVLTGAVRRQGFSRVWHTNVAGLTKYARRVSEARVIDEDGMPEEPIEDVKVGDIIRIDYGGAIAGRTPRSWDHVAALFEDKSDPDGPHGGGPDGKLDGFDVIVHMGHPRLELEPLSGQAPAKIDVLRWDARKMGRRRN